MVPQKHRPSARGEFVTAGQSLRPLVIRRVRTYRLQCKGQNVPPTSRALLLFSPRYSLQDLGWGIPSAGGQPEAANPSAGSADALRRRRARARARLRTSGCNAILLERLLHVSRIQNRDSQSKFGQILLAHLLVYCVLSSVGASQKSRACFAGRHSCRTDIIIERGL